MVNQPEIYGVRIVPVQMLLGQDNWRNVCICHPTLEENRGQYSFCVNAYDGSAIAVVTQRSQYMEFAAWPANSIPRGKP